MPEPIRQAPGWALRWEQAVLVTACALGLVAIPLLLGAIGLSWDALNHHIYLGWTAEHPRFHLDDRAASYQAYLFPYLYWPAYKLAVSGASGALAGVVLALLSALSAPAVWRIARACIPGTGWFDLAMRAIAVSLAFSSGVVLSLLDTTANDLLATVPLIWSVALGLGPLANPSATQSALRRAAVLSGLCAGVAVAFKLSNGPVAVVIPLLWVWAGPGLAARAQRLVLGCSCLVLGFAVVYGHWGWQLWIHHGNPIYPFADNWFAPLRELLGYRK